MSYPSSMVRDKTKKEIPSGWILKSHPGFAHWILVYWVYACHMVLRLLTLWCGPTQRTCWFGTDPCVSGIDILWVEVAIVDVYVDDGETNAETGPVCTK